MHPSVCCEDDAHGLIADTLRLVKLPGIESQKENDTVIESQKENNTVIYLRFDCMHIKYTKNLEARLPLTPLSLQSSSGGSNSMARLEIGTAARGADSEASVSALGIAHGFYSCKQMYSQLA